jgi:hypothetical protein
MKTSELQGAALDWAVHTAQGLSDEYCVVVDNIYGPQWRGPEYSTSWQEGGPLIEREFLHIHGSVKSNGDTDWCSLKVHETKTGCHKGHGPTPLIAAMRCFVASRLGDTVNIPEELQ